MKLEKYTIIKGVKQMKIYYIEYLESVKFFRNDVSIEIRKDKRLVMFLKAIYKKYGKKVKFKCLV